MMDVIIVDDEVTGRRTLREYCEAEGDLRVVGEYGDGAAALAAIRLRQPQLLFLDIQMDPLSGIDLARVRPRHMNSGADERQALLAGLLAQLERGVRAPGEERPRLLAEFGGHLHVLEAAQVEMIEADRNYVVMRVGKDSFHARSTLQQAEQALRTQPMLRISRSCLVNMNYVKEVNRTLRGDFILVLAGGATVTSSEGFRAKVKEHFSTLRLS